MFLIKQPKSEKNVALEGAEIFNSHSTGECPNHLDH